MLQPFDYTLYVYIYTVWVITWNVYTGSIKLVSYKLPNIKHIKITAETE